MLHASSFAEVYCTYTNNTGFVQRVRQAIAPLHQSKPDWMITFLIARQMGVDFGYDFSASSVFRQIADTVKPYEGLRYPHLRDESKPVQVKHQIYERKDLTDQVNVIRERVKQMIESVEKITETPRVGHKLHRLTTLTSKTPEFHLLAHGNPKPDNVFVSPLLQFDLNGKPKQETWTKMVGVGDRE